MTDTRHANVNWNLGEKTTWEVAHAALMMDIRDELRMIRRALNDMGKRVRRRRRRTKA